MEVQAYLEAEAELALQDRIQRETADKKNELESYVYGMRSKLSDALADYASPSVRDDLTQRLNDTEVRALLHHCLHEPGLNAYMHTSTTCASWSRMNCQPC